MIDIGLLAIAFTSGIFAFFTPCSVALIPGYVGFLIKHDEGNNVWRGIKVGLISALGLLTIFMGLGLLISIFGNFIAPYTFWVGVISGTDLILLGFYLLSGRSLNLPVAHSTNNQRGFQGYYFFGATYALASLACTLPIFLLVMSQALSSGGTQSSLIVFLVYSLTAASFMALTAFGTLTSKDLVSKYLKQAVPVVVKASPLLIILAGIYIIYFQLKAFYL